MKMVALFCVFLLFGGCSMLDLPPFGWDYPGFPHPEHFTSMAEIVLWTSSHIRWQAVKSWQTPETTYESRAGDCRAFTLLAMYFAHEAGIDTQLVILQVSQADSHAVLRVVSTGALMDPQTFTGALVAKESGPIIREISYEDAEWLSEGGIF